MVAMFRMMTSLIGRSGSDVSTLGRLPSRSRNWSTTASLTFSAAYWEWVMPESRTLASTASVCETVMYFDQSMRWTNA